MSQPDRPDLAGRLVVLGPDGNSVDGSDQQTGAAGQGEEIEDVTDQVASPAKVMRIGTMVKQLLEEVRTAPLDDASRRRLRDVHTTSIDELSDGLSPELSDELHRLTLPFSEDEVPSDAELRIAQAQLVGWLEGLFHGIQTTLFAQQMAAKMQAESGGRALPAGSGGSPQPGAGQGGSRTPGPSSSPYL